MKRFEDLDAYDDGYSTWSSQGGYKARWAIGVICFDRALETEGYTREYLCEDFEIDESCLMSKVTGRHMWTGYELDFLEDILNLQAPDKEE